MIYPMIYSYLSCDGSFKVLSGAVQQSVSTTTNPKNKIASFKFDWPLPLNYYNPRGNAPWSYKTQKRFTLRIFPSISTFNHPINNQHLVLVD